MNSPSVSQKYLKPIFEGLALQALMVLLSGLVLDGGTTMQICLMAMVAFWGGVFVMVWRHPKSPSAMDLDLIRFGHLLLLVPAWILVHVIWHLRGVE